MCGLSDFNMERGFTFANILDTLQGQDLVRLSCIVEKLWVFIVNRDSFDWSPLFCEASPSTTGGTEGNPKADYFVHPKVRVIT